MRITYIVEQCRHDINLLSNTIYTLSLNLSRRIIDDNRRTEATNIRLILFMITLVCMIAGNHENGILKPFLFTCRLEELTNSHISITDTFLDRKMLFFIYILIFIGNNERIMTRYGKDSRHERFFHFSHLLAIILHERFIPDSPVAVKVFITTKTGIFIIVLSTIIVLKTYLVGKSKKTHRPSIRTMEKGCLIAPFAQ